MSSPLLFARVASQIAGLEKVPVIIKKFDSRDETIEYVYKMQLNSRRLTDGEYFESARQVCKMREIAKKADASLLEKIQNGSVSINKAHEMIKAAKAGRKVRF